MIKYVIAVSLLLGAGVTSVSGQAPISSTAPAPPSIRVDPQQIRMLMDKARDATLKGNKTQADGYLEQLVEVARQGFITDDLDLASITLRKVLDLDPSFSSALFTLAELYRMTNPVLAVEYYNKYLRANPNDTNALLGRGMCYLGREKYALAVRDLQRLVDELDPTNVDGLAHLGLALAGRAGQRGPDPEMFKEAIQYFGRAVKLAEDRTDAESRAMLGKLKQRYAGLHFSYQMIMSLGSGGANYDEVIKYFADAITTLDKQVGNNPRDIQVLNTLQECYNKLMEVYLAQAEDDLKNPTPYLRLADVVQRATRITIRRSALMSLNYVEQAVEIAPENSVLQHKLMQALARIGMYEEAIKAVDKAAELDPRNKDQFDKLRKGLQEQLDKRKQTGGRPASPPAKP